MPRYFFNVVDGESKNVVKDIEGVMLPGMRAERKSAVDFARNFVKHGFREANQTWKVVVTDCHKRGRGYQTASAPTGGAIVAVRFAPQASAAEITKLLDAYNASLVGGPRPAGLYRLLIGEAAVPQEELAKLVDRIAREKVVEFVAAVQ